MHFHTIFHLTMESVQLLGPWTWLLHWVPSGFCFLSSSPKAQQEKLTYSSGYNSSSHWKEVGVAVISGPGDRRRGWETKDAFLSPNGHPVKIPS